MSKGLGLRGLKTSFIPGMVFLGLTVFSTHFVDPCAHAIEGEAEFVEKEIKAVRQAVREVVKIPSPPEPEEGKTDFVIMPIPISNPTVGTGLGAISMFLYKAGEKAPTSSTAFGGFYTNNDN